MREMCSAAQNGYVAVCAAFFHFSFRNYTIKTDFHYNYGMNGNNLPFAPWFGL